MILTCIRQIGITITRDALNGATAPPRYCVWYRGKKEEHQHRDDRADSRQDQTEVAAGSFDNRHFRFYVADNPPIDVWTLGSDFIPVRLRWDLLKQSDDLVELEGGTAKAWLATR